ncbi:hypothetical protein [Halomonas sp. MMSF_3323]|uniref:hypothetical protein n=1 Tax=Halomonas sp. MMSF_3323 TaxID=3046701 RepID=UPI00273FBA65|nr:hypothetical protein [Halomonas sp. MMSF_3323]
MQLPFLYKLLVFLFFLLFSAPVLAWQELRKTANLMSASEAILSVVVVVSEKFDERVNDLAWSAEFSENEWQVEMNGLVQGKESNVVMSGDIWGGSGEPMLVEYTGKGRVGGEPVSLSGKAHWLYNEETEDYHEMDFSQLTKIGENSFWGWVAGAEIIGGGIIGAGASVAAATIATGGVALGAGAWIAAGGAAGTASALVSMSNTVKSMTEGDAPPSEPEMPERSEAPKAGDEISPQENLTLVALSEDNLVTGSAPDGIHVMSGRYYIDDGFAEGDISILGN